MRDPCSRRCPNICNCETNRYDNFQLRLWRQNGVTRFHRARLHCLCFDRSFVKLRGADRARQEVGHSSGIEQPVSFQNKTPGAAGDTALQSQKYQQKPTSKNAFENVEKTSTGEPEWKLFLMSKWQFIQSNFRHLLNFSYRSFFYFLQQKLQGGSEPWTSPSVTCMRHDLYQEIYSSIPCLVIQPWNISLPDEG